MIIKLEWNININSFYHLNYVISIFYRQCPLIIFVWNHTCPTEFYIVRSNNTLLYIFSFSSHSIIPDSNRTSADISTLKWFLSRSLMIFSPNRMDPSLFSHNLLTALDIIDCFLCEILLSGPLSCFFLLPHWSLLNLMLALPLLVFELQNSWGSAPDPFCASAQMNSFIPHFELSKLWELSNSVTFLYLVHFCPLSLMFPLE